MPVDELEHARLQDEEATVDKAALRRRLLLEGKDLSALGDDTAESRRRPHAGHRGLAAVIGVEGKLCADIDVGQAVSVGHTKWFAGIQVFSHLQEPAAGHAVLAGIDESDLPGLASAIVILDPVLRHVEGDIGLMQEIIRKIFLDDISLVAETDHELPHAE